MPYNYAWAVADPEAGLDFGQVPFPTPFPVPVPGTFSNNPVQYQYQVPFPTIQPSWLILLGFIRF